MYMHIFIIIISVNIFVIYLTHDEDHKVIFMRYYASLTHACYIVLFCLSSTEDQAQETDQSSDGIIINNVIDINGQHYFNIFPCTRVIKFNAISWPWTKDFF